MRKVSEADTENQEGKRPPNGRPPYPCIERKYCNSPETPPKGPIAWDDVIAESGAKHGGYMELDCKCKSQWCSDCSLGRMVALRHQLRPVVGMWQSVQMVTLTVDPKGFESAESAYDYVREKRGIAVLMQHLKRRGHLVKPEWFCALEFHKSGWPHWHVVCHSEFVPVDEIRKGWKLGRIHITRSNQFESTAHAVHYATKYVSKKHQENETPDWVLKRSRIRKFSTSRALLPAKQKRWEPTEESRSYQPARPVEEQIAECGTGVHVFKKLLYMGGTRYEFVAKLTEEQRQQRDTDMKRKPYAAFVKFADNIPLDPKEKNPARPSIKRAG